MSVSASSRRPLVISLLCVGAVGIAMAGWFAFRSRPEAPLAAIDTPAARQSSREDAAADPQYVMVGGVRRKVTDVRRKRDAVDPSTVNPDPQHDPEYYGHTPPVKPDANPQVVSVVKAIREKRHPERLSPIIAPQSFDAAAFQDDPEAYLNTIEPGRVFQPAQPGPGVPRLQSVSPYFTEVYQGETVPLEVRAPAGSPVSFTCFDLGQFTSNQLTAITVQADSEGIARVEFLATPGSIEDCNILAASPQASGQVKFIVNIQLPPSAN